MPSTSIWPLRWQIHGSLTHSFKLGRSYTEALDLKNLTLVLHDCGGPIGLEYAVYHQENMKKLVLMNTFATVDFKLPWAFKAAFRSPVISDVLVRRLDVFGILAFKFGVRHKLSKQVLMNYREPHPTYRSRKGVAQFPRLIPASLRMRAMPPSKPCPKPWAASEPPLCSFSAIETPSPPALIRDRWAGKSACHLRLLYFSPINNVVSFRSLNKSDEPGLSKISIKPLI